MDTPPAYAELHCLSNFSFLRGASHPEELVERAHALGYSALALTDECSLAGVVRAHDAAKRLDLHLIVGAEFRLEDGLRLVVLAPDREAYGELCALITHARRAAPKGVYRLARARLETAQGCLALWLPGDTPEAEQGRWITARFPRRAWLAVELFRGACDRERLQALLDLGEAVGLPCVAAGDVHMHARGRRALQDTLTAVRLKCALAEAGEALFPNGERHLRPRPRLARLYPPALLAETRAIAARCRFSLDELRYRYPEEWLPPDTTPAEYLRKLTHEGMRWRWPQGAPARVRTLVEHELALIAELCYESYFLTVYDIVRFARTRDILCQGRGSAANSAVCYCLGVTEVDPARMQTLFERFVSKERDEPPDIDVDFEHERREEVIQYLYERYGRERAALAATVITYRTRSALRDVGKALGLSLEQLERAAKALAWWEGLGELPARLAQAGLDPANPKIHTLLVLVAQLRGFPRHLSQHVGGMVLTHDALSSMVPIENAAMPGRTVIQWDKNDLEAAGMMKVDCLALGMLTAIRKCFALVARTRGRPLAIADVPPEDARVYRMMSHADTVGVFQIESRAQMAMLPRLKPKTFYDLVIQVAIVRPGPIQGDMVHPYLRRREGTEAVSYPSEAVREALERTLGVPIFQEQVIKLAMVAAGFSAGEADRLRRAMAAWQRQGGLEPFERRLIEGMRNRGYSEVFARRIFAQIRGFGEYGFPESHAASFALLAYVSAWLKYYEPAAFTCALLNSQPMGFYGPAQLLADARRHGVAVLPADVNASEWDSTLERREDGWALRLGLRLIKGLSRAGAERVQAARGAAPLACVADLAARVRLSSKDLRSLAAADALRGFAGARRRAHWQVQGVEQAAPLAPASEELTLPLLPVASEAEEIAADYARLGFTLRRHPMALRRAALRARGVISAREFGERAHGSRVRVAGIVITRQRPSSDSGVVFLTLEDETGNVNVIVWRNVVDRFRRPLIQAVALEVEGELQRQGEIMYLVARRVRALADCPSPFLPQAPAVRR